MLSLLDLGGSVEPQVNVTVVVEEGLQHVQHLRHLREDEDAMAAALEFAEQMIQGLKLAAIVLDESGIRELKIKAAN